MELNSQGPSAIPRSYGKPALQSTTTPVSNGAGPEAVGVYIVGFLAVSAEWSRQGSWFGRAFCAGADV